MTRKSVSFHDSPPSSESSDRYKKAISDAKKVVAKSPATDTPIPRFDQVGTSWQQKPPQKASEFLSDTTKSQLKSLAELNASSKKDPTDDPTEDQQTYEGEAKAADTEKSPEDKLKEAVESRVSKLDIGQYIMSGVATQTVPVIPEKLVVVFRTITDAEEVYVDKVLSMEKDITNRQFIRRNNEYALATHIHSVNGNKWPVHINGQEEVDLEVMEVRLRHVRKLSSPIFNLLTDNLNWFLQRVHKELTFEVLGNG